MTSYSEEKAEDGEQEDFPAGPDEGERIGGVCDEGDGDDAGHESGDITFEGYCTDDVDQGTH